MSIRIVTDSTCDIPGEAAAVQGISVIPCYINIGGTSYLDGVNLSHKEFYQKMPVYPVNPTTSAPGIGTFVETYNKLAAEGATEIISIHVSANFSNVLNVAQLASQTVKETVPVTVVDSGQVSLGLGFAVLDAARAALAGHSLVEILNLVKAIVSRSYTFAVLDTLEYLQRSGRVSKLQNTLGTLLQIDPFVKVFSGEVILEKIRTYSKSVERLIKSASELAPLDHLAILHTSAPEKADILKGQLKHLLSVSTNIWTVEATPAIGTHVGPGAVGISCVQAPR
jgi:DegV family protein with EDD domain